MKDILFHRFPGEKSCRYTGEFTLLDTLEEVKGFSLEE